MTALDELRSALITAELDVADSDDGLRVRVEPGLRSRTAVLDDTAVPDEVAALSDVALRRAALSSIARGVYAVLCEPTRSGADELAFEDVARTVRPTIEGRWYAHGVQVAGGEAPWLRPFVGDLVVGYVVDLDRGQRLLSQSQVEGWGVTSERLEKAGISILFHRTRMGDLRAHDTHDGFDVFSAGDGHDAARVLMLDMWDYPRTRGGVFVGIPDPETLLVGRGYEKPDATRFATVVEAAWREAEQPLSPHVFAFVDGKLQPDPVAAG